MVVIKNYFSASSGNAPPIAPIDQHKLFNESNDQSDPSILIIKIKYL